MKKNKMMRAASALLVAVLLTTCSISGTFAKYVTKESATDTARVAKWGVFFDLEGGPLFSKEYAKDDRTAGYTSMTTTVKTSAEDNVVAPGTAGTLVEFRTTGTPEVSYKVTFDVDNETLETVFTKKSVTYDEKRVPTATGLPDGYYPVVFTLTLNGGAAVKYTDIEELAAAIEGFTYYYNVGDGKYYVKGSGQDEAPTFSLNWAWAFDTQSQDGANDVLDTTLGNLAADVPGVKTEVGTEGIDYNLDITVGITATAIQID